MSDKPPPYPGDVGGYGQPPPAAYAPVQQAPPPFYGQQPQAPPPQGYPPPPQGYQPYPPTQQHTQQTVVVTAPASTTTVIAALGPSPTAATCPNCSRSIVTETESSPNGMAWLCCFLLFVCGFWLCCFIPFCMDGFQDVTHRCPSCKHTLGEYKR